MRHRRRRRRRPTRSSAFSGLVGGFDSPEGPNSRVIAFALESKTNLSGGVQVNCNHDVLLLAIAVRIQGPESPPSSII